MRRRDGPSRTPDSWARTMSRGQHPTAILLASPITMAAPSPSITQAAILPVRFSLGVMSSHCLRAGLSVVDSLVGPLLSSRCWIKAPAPVVLHRPGPFTEVDACGSRGRSSLLPADAEP